MSTDVVTMRRNETLDLADRIMSLGRIRHMPVIDEDDRLCERIGIITESDFVRWFASAPR